MIFELGQKLGQKGQIRGGRTEEVRRGQSIWTGQDIRIYINIENKIGQKIWLRQNKINLSRTPQDREMEEDMAGRSRQNR